MDNLDIYGFQKEYANNVLITQQTVALQLGLSSPNLVVVTYPPASTASASTLSAHLSGLSTLKRTFKGHVFGLAEISTLAVQYNVTIVLGEGNSYASTHEAVSASASKLQSSIASGSFTTSLNAIAASTSPSGSALLTTFSNKPADTLAPQTFTIASLAPSAKPTASTGSSSTSSGLSSGTLAAAIVVPIIFVIAAAAGAFWYFNMHPKSDQSTAANSVEIQNIDNPNPMHTTA